MSWSIGSELEIWIGLGALDLCLQPRSVLEHEIFPYELGKLQEPIRLSGRVGQHTAAWHQSRIGTTRLSGCVYTNAAMWPQSVTKYRMIFTKGRENPPAVGSRRVRFE